MKKNLVLIALALFSLALVGCGEKKEPEPAAVEQGTGDGPKNSSGAVSAQDAPNLTNAEAEAHVGSKK